MFRDATRAVTLVAAAMRGADFDVAGSRRAPASGGTTLTELADTLVRDHGLPFRPAHAIAALLLKARTEDPRCVAVGDALAKASQALLGRALDYSEAQLQKMMSPRTSSRSGRPGGPAPEETLPRPRRIERLCSRPIAPRGRAPGSARACAGRCCAAGQPAMTDVQRLRPGARRVDVTLALYALQQYFSR